MTDILKLSNIDKLNQKIAEGVQYNTISGVSANKLYDIIFDLEIELKQLNDDKIILKKYNFIINDTDKNAEITATNNQNGQEFFIRIDDGNISFYKNTFHIYVLDDFKNKFKIYEGIIKNKKQFKIVMKTLGFKKQK